MTRLDLGIMYIMFCAWVLTFGGLLIFLYEKSKKKKKAKTVQPQIEVYEKNYKKVNNASKFDRVG